MNTIQVEQDPRGVATVTLARPDKRNAMSAEMIAELGQVAAQLGCDDTVRAVVLRGAGPTFCAGGDLGWMRAQAEAAPEARRAAASTLADMLGAWNILPKPVIGRIHGDAYGGGVGLACICDVAVASATARFALTETRLGLIPATIGPYVVARMGEAMARRVFLSGRRFDAHEAVKLGVVAAAVPPEELDLAVEAEIAPYFACAPGAVAEAKALLRQLGAAIDADHTAHALQRRWESAEAAEGIAAFFAKRPPAWHRDPG